jgi:hypothetical protein
MNTNTLAADTNVDSPLVSPTVFTRNFCMYVVKVCRAFQGAKPSDRGVDLTPRPAPYLTAT